MKIEITLFFSNFKDLQFLSFSLISDFSKDYSKGLESYRLSVLISHLFHNSRSIQKRLIFSWFSICHNRAESQSQSLDLSLMIADAEKILQLH